MSTAHIVIRLVIFGIMLCGVMWECGERAAKSRRK